MKRIEKLCFLILFSDDAPAALAADNNNVQKTPITKTKTEKVCKRHYIGCDFMKSLHIVCIMTAEMHDYAHKRVLCENKDV